MISWSRSPRVRNAVRHSSSPGHWEVSGERLVHTAKKLGVRVIAGVRASQMKAAAALGVADVLAIDEDGAIKSYPMVDGILDTVGGETAGKLFAKVKNGGSVTPPCFPKVYPLPTPPCESLACSRVLMPRRCGNSPMMCVMASLYCL